MKKIFILLSLCILLVNLGSAYVYDNFADGTVNWSFWQNSTTHAGAKTITEVSNQLRLTDNNANDGSTSLWSEKLLPSYFIKWINMSLQWNLGSGAGGSFSLGVEVFNQSVFAIGGSNPANPSGTTTISLYRNRATGAFEVNNGTAWSVNITPTGRNVYGSVSGSGNGPYTRELYFGQITFDTYGVWNNITSPTNGSLTINTFGNPVTLSINSTAILEMNLTNVTSYIYYSNGSLQNKVTLNLTGKSILSTFGTTINTPGDYYSSAYTCGTNSTYHACYNSGNISFTNGYRINQEIWSNSTTVSATESYYLGLTVGSGASLSAANLFYKNTTYSVPIVQSGDDYFLNYSLSPTVSMVGTNNLYWNLIFSNGFSTNTTTRTQTVVNIPAPIVSSTNCGTGGYSPAYNFTVKDEKNFTIQSAQISYNFKYGTNNGTTASIFGSFTSTPTFLLCFNFSNSPTWTIGEGQIHYTVFPNSSYVERNYYIFDNTLVINRTENVSLYDLETSEQTSFKLEILDGSSLLPLEDKYTALMRWYPELDEYKIVEMGKTDELGTTVLHVETEDVDYRVAIYERNGTLLKLASPTRMICLINPCTYTIKIEDEEQDLTSFLNIQHTLTYNYTTGIWLFTYSDQSQRTDLMNLTVYRITGTSTFPVCSSSSTAFTGVLSCNTSIYTGTLKAVVERVASPPIPIASKIIDVVNSAFTSSYGLWISLLIAIPIALIFAFISPVGAVVGGVIALIPAFYLGSVNTAIIGGIAVLGGIVVHFMKRV